MLRMTVSRDGALVEGWHPSAAFGGSSPQGEPFLFRRWRGRADVGIGPYRGQKDGSFDSLRSATRSG